MVSHVSPFYPASLLFRPTLTGTYLFTLDSCAQLHLLSTVLLNTDRFKDGKCVILRVSVFPSPRGMRALGRGATQGRFCQGPSQS